jgi:hypothetical protein
VAAPGGGSGNVQSQGCTISLQAVLHPLHASDPDGGGEEEEEEEEKEEKEELVKCIL